MKNNEITVFGDITETKYYDDADRLIKIEYSNGIIVEYRYDDRGNLINISNSNGYSEEYRYDDQNRLVYFSDTYGNEKHILYDGDKRHIKQYKNGELTLEYTENTDDNLSLPDDNNNSELI